MTKYRTGKAPPPASRVRPEMPISVAEEMFPHDEDFLEDYERGSASVQVSDGRVLRRGGFRWNLSGDD